MNSAPIPVPDTVSAPVPVVVIAGPTASGKSALGLHVAQALGGEIVNADSMQVYRDLRVLTARPTAAEEAVVPHHLYGVFDGAQACSAAYWAERAAACLRDIHGRGRLPLLLGGTGLYIKAMMEGFSPIPDVPEALRLELRARLRTEGNAAFHAELAAVDPVTAARLPVGDSQRLLRAREVYEATGRPLSDWHKAPPAPVINARFLMLTLIPPRPTLYARCDVRFDQMLEQGAIEEVRALLDRHLSPDLPVMKSLGVPELAAHLRGEISLAEAADVARQSTRRFAKRQMTWLRNQIIADISLSEKFMERLDDEIFPKIRSFLLTP